jgi:hypothetical protein
MLFNVPGASSSLGFPGTVTRRFGRMLELAMAAACDDEVPTIIIQHAENLANFHRSIILRAIQLAKAAA